MAGERLWMLWIPARLLVARGWKPLTIKLCLALSHPHGPCSCQAVLSARLSLYSRQPLNEPALTSCLITPCFACLSFLKPRKLSRGWRDLQAPRAPEGAPSSSTQIVFSSSVWPQKYFAKESPVFPCSVPTAGPVTAPALL